MDSKPKNINSAVSSQPSTSRTDLTLAQINLLHCKKATYNLCRDLTTKHTGITLIQEPWVRGKKIHGFGQLHNRLFYNRAGSKPRAAIHVSPNVEAMVLNQFTDDDLVTVRVCRKSTEGGDFIVVSAYLPFDSTEPLPGSSLEKIVIFCKIKQVPLIVGTDANAHHKIWGSSNINSRGEELVQYLLTTDLMVQNRGDKPTFVNSAREECIDVTLATCDISELIHSWRVCDDETFSDHKLIKFNLKGHFPQRKPFRNPRKTNWDQYRSLLKEKLDSIGHQERFLTVESLEKGKRRLYHCHGPSL